MTPEEKAYQKGKQFGKDLVYRYTLENQLKRYKVESVREAFEKGYYESLDSRYGNKI